MFRAISSHIRSPLRSLPQALTLGHSPFEIPLDPSQSTASFASISTLSSPLRRRHENAQAADEYNRRLFVVQPRLRPEPVLRVKLDEALSLANSLEQQRDGFFDTELSEKELPPHVVVQNPAAKSPRAGYFQHLFNLLVRFEENLDSVLGIKELDFESAPEVEGLWFCLGVREWEKPVLDRVGLIIDIFNAHAFTKEAKLQAELAALMYKRSRLVRVRGPDGRYTFGAMGEAEVVSARGKGSGGRGFTSGAGETELQLQRRRIVDRRKQLLYEMKEVRRTRALQRAARKRHGGANGQGIATVAVVGYTNALVEAFHATLEEVVEADLLVHVLDSSAPNLDEHRETVLQVLKQIGVSEEKLQTMVEVWNKIDLEEGMGADERLGDGEDKVIGCLSGAEDDDVASDCDDNNEDAVSEISQGDNESIGDQQSDYSNGWILSEDEDETLNEMGWKTPNDQQSMVSEEGTKTENSSHSQSLSVPHVKTSAIMGVGLQELLELIDSKLKSQNVVERNIIDRKWRPPRTEDTDMTVEQ
ncbi:GTP-binding protein, HflX [Actinidia rufa]|uniref:GTP-binding protein, HflX n=1 Tax=Actinidia rufa TaxID=165716 RepID=A0A7J0H727_9ERIC|nr:GTP-binding protein, HflX [Actinidia rufa]